MKSPFRFALRHTALALSLLALSSGSMAQQQYPPRNGNGMMPGMAPQFQQMRVLMEKYQTSRPVSEPARSAANTLLRRDDVRSEIKIDGRQREQLDALGGKAQQDQQTQQREAFTKFREQMRNNRPNGSNAQNMTPDERRAQMTSMRDKMQESQKKMQASYEKDAESLLRPAQIKRLHELDLQWRGPLALADTDVAEKLALTPEQIQPINVLVQEFRAEQQKQLRDAMAGMFGQRVRQPRGNGAPGAFGRNGSNPNGNAEGNAPNGSEAVPGDASGSGEVSAQATPPRPADPIPAPAPQATPTLPSLDEMKRTTDAQTALATKTRKTYEAKVLALLTPAQKQQWLLLQGRPFLFRADL